MRRGLGQVSSTHPRFPKLPEVDVREPHVTQNWLTHMRTHEGLPIVKSLN